MERYTLLIADDNDCWRDILRFALSAQPWLQVVGAAQNGEEAFSMIEEHRPQILLLDAIMPELDGLQLIRRLPLEMPDYHPIVYVMTGIRCQFVREEISSLPVDYFTMLPTSVNTIIAQLRQLVEPHPSPPALQTGSDPLPTTATETEENETEQAVERILSELGLRPCARYHLYTSLCLQHCLQDPTCLSLITKMLYPHVAKQCNVGNSAIEHGVRHSISVAVKHKSPLFYRLFPHHEYTSISNVAFLERLRQYLSE